MIEHSETRIVPYTADLMYGVVADIERYPEFLPWVVALRIKSRAKEGARAILIAEMAVGYRTLRERYTSRVVLDPEARTIDVVAIEGAVPSPGKSLALHAGRRERKNRFPGGVRILQSAVADGGGLGLRESADEDD